MLFGLFLPTLIFREDFDNDIKFKNKIQEYMTIILIINGIFCSPSILFFKEKPEKFTCKSQKIKEKIPFFESIRTLLKNIEFIKLCLFNSLVIGYWTLYITVLNDYLSFYEFSSTMTSTINTVSMFSGIVITIGICLITDKGKKFKTILSYVILVCLFFHILMTLFLELLGKESFYYVMIFYSIIQTGCTSVYVIGQDYVCEITYPIGII